MKRWTIEEITYLTEKYRYFKNSDLALHLHRTEEAIRTQAKKLKLGKQQMAISQSQINIAVSSLNGLPRKVYENKY